MLDKIKERNAAQAKLIQYIIDGDSGEDETSAAYRKSVAEFENKTTAGLWNEDWFYVSPVLKDSFGLMFVDEAHQCKGRRTRVFLSLKLLEADCKFLVSATIDINSIHDFVPPLNLLWRPEMISFAADATEHL
ncbi:hypothetical protein KCU65_g2625, partial [Aureobasidium melanogenum]